MNQSRVGTVIFLLVYALGNIFDITLILMRWEGNDELHFSLPMFLEMFEEMKRIA